MELSDLNLNQLVVFHHLMVERRVSKVADKLGLTQPAISNALGRLRRALGDELFLRTPAGMVPTPYAEQLAEPIAQALAGIHTALNRQDRFDPAEVRRTLTIGMTDIGEIVFLPALVDRLRIEAPGITLRTVRTSVAPLREAMEAGQVDLAIGPLPELKAGFFQRRLFSQRYVCLFRQGHRLNRRRITLADFRAAEHLVIASAGTAHGQVDASLRALGIDRDIRLTVPHFVSVGHLLRGSDLVATVTERLAESLVEPFGLAWRPHPVRLPEVMIRVFWHAKVHKSPIHQWLRDVVFDLFGEGGKGLRDTVSRPRTGRRSRSG